MWVANTKTHMRDAVDYVMQNTDVSEISTNVLEINLKELKE